ncbi:AAA family ATPase [Candidatus Poribacteria bacterium]|nr:AAA family ATPase [Candidatus Poribacteria bacterium]MYG06763.1 AAA family ATPase [Candidatus Poribacteria bacterium]MYK21190.1 AAA family ATPase [Candidatus Poribacteria bacterium]
MKRFGTEGRLYPEDHYIVPRTKETADFIDRIKQGKYIVLFAPRQTGKTTFFRLALDALTTEDLTYLPIQLNFEEYEDATAADFYAWFYADIRKEIENVFQKREEVPSETLTRFLDNAKIIDHVSTKMFFEKLADFLKNQKVVLLIDEFDAMPRKAVKGFLRSLRRIYLSGRERCPYSVGIVGVQNIIQLNYDRSISPFNIQDEFHLPNFTLEQVKELLGQYTEEVGQGFAPEVMASIHKQTAGQPVLVNRLAQILTEEMDIPKTETIAMEHFTVAHTRLLRGRNTNIEHLTTNIRRNPRFESVLMRIMAREEGVDFNLDDDIISELATYGVIKEGTDGMCEILNPIYLYRIMRAFKPLVNGLEQEYFPEDTGEALHEYLTSTGQIEMEALLDNFRDFIARAGFRILQVPDTPQESVGRHLLLAYLDEFVRRIGGVMHIEVQTGRGRMDILITHNTRKYIVETKIWRGESRYQAGKQQLAAYLTSEGATEGYYVVFDHRQKPEPRVETEMLEGLAIRSYVIPMVQECPSAVHPTSETRESDQ